MTNATPTRLGQSRGAGSVDALFLKVFSGEVITAFERMAVFRPHLMTRNITAGLSAQFPILGRRGAPVIHTPGAFLTGGSVQAAERVITIEGLLLADAFIAQIDELINHYDVRSEYARVLGESLAFDFDFNAARISLLAARVTGAANENPDAGSGIVVSNAAVPGAVSAGALVAGRGIVANGDDLITALSIVAQRMDERYVPGSERRAFLRPAQYNLLARTDRAVNRDLNGENGGIKDGKVMDIAGLPIQKTNHIPSTDESTAGPRVPYRGNYVNSVGIVSQRGAVGAVIRQDVTLESEYEIQRQGTLMVAKMAAGMGILRPEASAELSAAVV